MIITSPDNASRWGELLAQTEITYELKDEYKTEYLQEGGFDISLTNGSIIHSYDYIKIKNLPKENAYLFTKIDGTEQKINKLQIVDVTPIVTKKKKD